MKTSNVVKITSLYLYARMDETEQIRVNLLYFLCLAQRPICLGIQKIFEFFSPDVYKQNKGQRINHGYLLHNPPYYDANFKSVSIINFTIR